MTTHARHRSGALLRGALLLASSALASSAATRADDAALSLERLPFASGAGSGQPSVTADAREGFVLTWQQREGERATLRFAVLDGGGRERRRGVIAEGTGWFVNWADFPSLAVLDNGDWVSFFLQKTAAPPYAYEIRLVRSTDRGASWSAPVVPHTDGTPTQHGFVALAPAGADRVRLVWLDGRTGATADAPAADHDHDHDEGAMTLRTAVLDRRGVRSEERELDASTCSCCQTTMVRSGRRTLLAYRARSAGEIRDIAFIERSAAGEWSASQPVHADGWRIEGCPVNGPALAAHGERALVIWPTIAEPPLQVRHALRTGGEFSAPRVLDAGRAVLGRVHAAAWPGGRFLVSWLGGEGEAAGLRLALLDARGEVLGRAGLPLPVPTRMRGNPRLAVHAGGALVAWGDAADGGRVALAMVRAGAGAASPVTRR